LLFLQYRKRPLNCFCCSETGLILLNFFTIKLFIVKIRRRPSAQGSGCIATDDEQGGNPADESPVTAASIVLPEKR
jgi:hypothetical protein